MPPAAQLTSFERDRTARLRSARGTGLNIPTASQRRPPPSADGPVFGEEGFGDIETMRGRTDTPRSSAGADTEETPAYETEAAPGPQQRLRPTYSPEEESAESQEEGAAEAPKKPGLSDAWALLRDQIDVAVNAACYALPVLGHWLWWNLRMAFGSWIMKGNSRYVGPFGWSDVIMVILPGGKVMGSGMAGKAVAQILPDFIAHLLLVFIDLWIFTAVAMLLIFQMLVLYLFYLAITDPIGSLAKFGDLITSFL